MAVFGTTALVAQTADAVAVKIVGPDYVDYAMVGFGNPVDEKRLVTLANPAGGESFVFSSFAYLRCRAKSLVGRRNLASLVIAGSGGAAPALSLNGQPAPRNAARSPSWPWAARLCPCSSRWWPCPSCTRSWTTWARRSVEGRLSPPNQVRNNAAGTFFQTHRPLAHLLDGCGPFKGRWKDGVELWLLSTLPPQGGSRLAGGAVGLSESLRQGRGGRRTTLQAGPAGRQQDRR